MRRPLREERQKRTGLKGRTPTAARANSRDALFGVGVGGGAETGSCEQRAESVFAGSTALGARDVSFAIDHNVNGISGCGVHGGEIGVFGEDDATGARILVEIFLDGFPGFADVDGENNEIFLGVFVADFFDKRRFGAAVSAPGRPELEQDYFAFDGSVREGFAGGRLGVETWSRFLWFGVGVEVGADAETKCEKCGGQEIAHEVGGRVHDGNIAQIRPSGLSDGLVPGEMWLDPMTPATKDKNLCLPLSITRRLCVRVDGIRRGRRAWRWQCGSTN